jgi:hypothetical protein
MAAQRKYPKAPKLRLGRLCQLVRAVFSECRLRQRDSW